jgi:hypothetical protein
MTIPATKLTQTLHPNHEEKARRWTRTMRWLLLLLPFGFDTAENQLHPPKTAIKTKARNICFLLVGAVPETSDMVVEVV